MLDCPQNTSDEATKWQKEDYKVLECLHTISEEAGKL